MKRKRWESKAKFRIVMEGFKGRAVADICIDHGISQSMYYKWRDQIMSEGYKVFDVAKENQQHDKINRENSKLKHLVGELTYELKKNDEIPY